jgi:hypothetical protein
MDVDQVLRGAGREWRDHGLEPMEMPDFDAEMRRFRPARRPDRNARKSRYFRGMVLVPAAAAVGVFALVGGAAVLVRSSGGVERSAVPPPVAPPPVAPLPSDGAPAPAKPQAQLATPPLCTGRQLTVKPFGRGVELGGSVYVAFEVRNTGKACWLEGWPTVTGVSAAGAEVDLRITKDDGESLGTSGPGVLRHGARGLVTLQGPGTQLCEKPLLTVPSVRITVRGRPHTFPMPTLLRRFSCGGSIFPFGVLDPSRLTE